MTIKCDKCRHAEKCPAKAEHGGALRCSAYKPQEQTNEEWLRSATTEQLAEWIVSTNRCKTDHLCSVCRQKWCDKKYVVEWLKQPHNS